jgi:1,4-alpha-glucan branching enzyme
METSQQVWSSIVGYPGNPVYREFYRDIGWDLPLDYLKPHLHKEGNRRHLGLKYYRISGRDVPSDKKEPYVPNWAREKVVADAADFVGKRIRQAHKLRETFEGHPPLVNAPYDAELYGHWWFEGPQFLDFLFRELHYKRDLVEAITPGDFLDARIPIQIQQPTASSWGANGYYKVWLNEGNSWMYPYHHDAERKMNDLANRFDNPNEIDRRVLNQLARELLLAQSSDWAFQIYQGTTVQYSSNRFKAHIHRFDLLATNLENGEIDEELLREIESRDNIFAEIDYRIYKS